MSLGIVVKGSEGVVLAADSRISLQVQAVPMQVQQGQPLPANLSFFSTFDNATKLLTFGKPHKYVAAVTYGDAVMGTAANTLRTAQSLLPEFEVDLPKERISVQDFATQLSEFFLKQWNDRMPASHPGPGMIFVIAGYDGDKPYGSVYVINIPRDPTPQQRNPDSFGITMGGQNEIIRLIQGYDPNVLAIAKQVCNLSNTQVESLKLALSGLNLPIPYPVLPLQDCIDLAIFLIRTTVTAQNLSIGLRGVGGAIDVAAITRRDGVRIIQRKELAGERVLTEITARQRQAETVNLPKDYDDDEPRSKRRDDANTDDHTGQ